MEYLHKVFGLSQIFGLHNAFGSDKIFMLSHIKIEDKTVYFGPSRCGAGATSPDAIYPDAQHIHHQVHHQVHLHPPGVLGQAKVGHTTPGGGAIRIDILLQISYFFVLFLLTIIMSCSSS